jgi:hypothetical protein
MRLKGMLQMPHKEDALTPDEALARLFDLIREQAGNDRRFARQLLEAMGVTVIFRGEEALEAMDPVLVAANGYDEFRQTFASFKITQLKKIIKEFGLATASDMKGKKLPQLIDIMWEGASNKRHDSVPSWRK